MSHKRTNKPVQSAARDGKQDVLEESTQHPDNKMTEITNQDEKREDFSQTLRKIKCGKKSLQVRTEVLVRCSLHVAHLLLQDGI